MLAITYQYASHHIPFSKPHTPVPTYIRISSGPSTPQRSIENLKYASFRGFTRSKLIVAHVAPNFDQQHKYEINSSISSE